MNNTTALENLAGENATTAIPIEVKSTIEVLTALPPISYQVFVFWGLGLFGTVLNVLSIKILERFPSSSFYFYLKCLSGADLWFNICILLGCIKNTAIVLMKYYWFGFIFAHIQPWMLYTASHCSTLTTVWMSIERFIVIQFPLQARNWFTLKTARLAAVFIFGFCILFDLRYVFITTLVQKFHPDTGALYFTARAPFFFTDTAQQLLFIGSIVHQYLPSVLLLVCNLAIIVSCIIAARKRKDMQNQGAADKSFRQELRVTFVLLCIVLLFLVLEAPISIPYLMALSPAIRVVFNITYITNHSINFFTYFVSNGNFRQQAWLMLKEKTTGKEPASTVTSMTNAEKSSSIKRHQVTRSSTGKMAAVAASVKKNIAESG